MKYCLLAYYIATLKTFLENPVIRSSGNHKYITYLYKYLLHNHYITNKYIHKYYYLCLY